MYQLFITDFARNRTIQLYFISGIGLNIGLAQSIKHIVVLFGLPYLTSIAMNCRIRLTRKKVKARISAQYRN